MTEQYSNPDLQMTGKLGWSDLEFKINMAALLKAPVKKWTKCKDRWVSDNFKNQWKILEIKNCIWNEECLRPINTLATTKEIGKNEQILIETPKTEM